MAKPPYGLLRGTFSIMGDYDECLEVRATKKGDVALTKEEEYYHGQYCLVEVEFPEAMSQTLIDYNNKKVNLSAFGKFGPVSFIFIFTYLSYHFILNVNTFSIKISYNR